MDPSGPFWGASPADKYVHTRRHKLEKIDEKMHVLGSRLAGARQGVSNIKIVQNLPIQLGSAQKLIYIDDIHLKLTIWPKWSKSPKSP